MVIGDSPAIRLSLGFTVRFNHQLHLQERNHVVFCDRAEPSAPRTKNFQLFFWPFTPSEPFFKRIVDHLNDPYAWLNSFFPGEFTLRERLRSAPPPSAANLNLEEAAEYLGVSPRHLKDFCLEKRIVFAKPHYRSFSFRREDLDAWLAAYRMNRR